MLNQNERNISFGKYMLVKILEKIKFLFFCKCSNKQYFCKTVKTINKLITEIESLIYKSYSLEKYQDLIDTSYLLEKVLFDEKQKSGVNKIDFEVKR